MAYLWSDKVTDFYYSNPESDTVAVLWTDPDDGVTREHYIKVDEEDQQWRDFVAEFPYEEINTRSDTRNENFREEFREAFRSWAQREDVDFNDPNSTNKFEDVIINFISEFDNTDADQKEQYGQGFHPPNGIGGKSALLYGLEDRIHIFESHSARI